MTNPLYVSYFHTPIPANENRIVEVTTVLFLASTLIYGVQIVINVVNVHE